MPTEQLLSRSLRAQPAKETGDCSDSQPATYTTRSRATVCQYSCCSLSCRLSPTPQSRIQVITLCSLGLLGLMLSPRDVVCARRMCWEAMWVALLLIHMLVCRGGAFIALQRRVVAVVPGSSANTAPSNGFIESVARDELPEHVTAEFGDGEPGAPYPTQ